MQFYVAMLTITIHRNARRFRRVRGFSKVFILNTFSHKQRLFVITKIMRAQWKKQKQKKLLQHAGKIAGYSGTEMN